MLSSQVLSAELHLTHAQRRLPHTTDSVASTHTVSVAGGGGTDTSNHDDVPLRVEVMFFRDSLRGQRSWRFEGRLAFAPGEVEEARRDGALDAWVQKVVGGRCVNAEVCERVGNDLVVVLHFV